MAHGGISLIKIGSLRHLLDNANLSNFFPTLVIVIGAFIFFISLIGCCGAMRENRCLLETYSISLLMLILTQIVLAVLIFLFIDDIQRESLGNFNRMWRTRGNSKESRMMLDLIQENLECCGSSSVFDYNPDQIPLSCCKRDVELCSRELSYTLGCKSTLKDTIKSSAIIISYLCVITAIFELLASLLGFILSGYVRKINGKSRCC
jgi:hypothetical protein